MRAGRAADRAGAAVPRGVQTHVFAQAARAGDKRMILVDGLLIVHVAFPVKPAHVAIVEPVNIGRLSVLCGAELIVVCTRLRANHTGTLCGMRARGVTAGAGHRVTVFLPVVAALEAAHLADDSAVSVCAVAAMWALIVTVGADAPVIE